MPSRNSLKTGIIEDGHTVEQLLCMNGGEGQTSYAKNSNLQRNVMSGASDILEESVTKICKTFLSCKSLSVADLGCGTGPNALQAVSKIVDMVSKNCDEHVVSCPSFLLFLNDLPSNDFNSLLRSLGGPYDLIRRVGIDSFVMAASGSFYGRLFPSKSLHFVHSSYALMWLSQAPKWLIGSNGEALNKGNIYLAETSSHAVYKAYNDQFKQDFTLFLKSRSEELIPGGNMVLTILGCATPCNATFNVYAVIGLTLCEMAKEGLIKESELDMFNLPFHAASDGLVREVILEEGSFHLNKLKVLKTKWDAGIEEDEVRAGTNNGVYKGKYVAKYMRAVAEPLLVAAFGENIMDELFRRVAMKFSELMNARVCHYDSFVVSLTRNSHV